MKAFDPVLSIVSGETHVGLTVETIDTGIGTTDSWDNKVSLRDSIGILGNALDCRKRLVAYYQVV